MPEDETCLRGRMKSDILSDTKTFTVRDLDRKPGKVLDVCDREGAVRIQRRNGRKYTLQSDRGMSQKAPWRKWYAEHVVRMKRIFPERISQEQVEVVDKMLRGE